ncbi:hypothetical protein RF55_18781 [Lasius niger]|uniref:Uncharacterized protein n=1 Tax=Lasius niger TaxID=67767 RepID=A0A0J7K161_LASNI|nr:hypothetical protein RF55_18781 [Lasius niger]
MDEATQRDILMDDLILEIDAASDMLSDAPAGASAHVSPGAPANVSPGASANVSISEPVVPSTKPRFIIPRRAVSAVNNNEPGRAVPTNEAGPAVPVNNEAGPAVSVNNNGPGPAVPDEQNPHWRPRGKRAGVRVQDHHFMTFLYKLSAPNYHWGPKRGRGRGRGNNQRGRGRGNNQQ